MTILWNGPAASPLARRVHHREGRPQVSTPFRLLLPTQFYTAMLAQAQAELPNECCGLLAGRLDPAAGVGRVEKRYPLVNLVASPVEFLSEPVSMFAAVKDMRRLGLDVLAVYHSHPTAAPVPSRKDHERNYSPEVVNLIISLQGKAPVVRGWWLTADDSREAAWGVVEEAPPLQ